MANKDIGKAYKESLQDQNLSPHNRVWERIEEQLDTPKRRTFPLWLLFGGLALLIAIPSSIYLYSTYNSTQTTETPSNVSTTKIDNSKNSDINDDIYTISTSKDSTTINSTTYNSKDSEQIEAQATSTISSTTNGSLSNRNSSSNNRTRTNSTKKGSQLNTLSSTKTNLYNTGSSRTSNWSDSNVSNNQTSSRPNSVSNYSNSQNRNDTTNTSDNRLYINSTSSKDLSANKLNAYPIAELGTLAFTKHDLGFTTKQEKEDRKNKRTVSIKAYGGPQYFGSLKDGYSIDETLAGKPTEKEVTFNYGAALVFELTKKSNISVGIGKTDLKYTVKQADSINFQGNLVNAPSYFNIQLNNNDTSILGNFSSIDFTQELSYLEFPVLYYYSPIKNKLSLDIYGGPSFLALIENRIIAQSTNGNSLQIGQANNLGKFSVGLNLGIGVSYQLSNKFNIGLEPIFKYYINTFNNNSNFKPYSLGVNLGIRFKL